MRSPIGAFTILAVGRASFISLLLAACAVFAIPASAAAAIECSIGDSGACARAASDGSRVLFTTNEELVSADDFANSDVYELQGKKLTLLTPKPSGQTGPKSHSWLMGLSRDGRRALIETQNAYSPLDTDTIQDLYVLEGGRWTMVSPPGGLAPGWLEAFSGDAHHIFFSSQFADLVPTDTDHDGDLYEWNDGLTRIVSTGPTERTAPPPSNFTYYVGGHVATSDDGAYVFFSTYDHLTADDTNEDVDIYERDNAATTALISIPGSPAPPLTPNTSVGGVAADGSHLFLDTNRRADPADTDDQYDVYDRTGLSFTLISTGPLDDGNIGGSYLGSSADGSHVFFETTARLVPGDTDSTRDIYERFGGTSNLVSIGPSGGNGVAPSDFFPYSPHFEGASGDGTAVAFSTKESLVPSDDDQNWDIYVRRGGTTELISTGPTDRNEKYVPRFAGFTDSGSAVIFWSDSQLVPTDNDHTIDVYERVQVAGATAAVRKHRKRAKSKTKLVSAEHIPPKVRVAAHGRRSGGVGSVRITCPKKEKSAPCVGSASARGGKGKFRIRRGRSAWVTVGGVGRSARVVVKARDQLGNRAKVKQVVRF